MASFSGDRLSELQTEDGDTCFAGDDSCYPSDFSPSSAVQSYLAPFAGLAVGEELPFEFELMPTSDADCALGDAFDCRVGTSYDETRTASGELSELEVFDAAGDYDLRIDTEADTVDFFGAAGDFLPAGCTAADGAALELPDGYCGFFGYQASFELTSEISEDPDGHVTPIPLNASMVFALFGLASLAGFSRAKRP
ncbi:hypothetical protein [Roseobacter sinensis]|uniref:Uncharacterized protein n=1 Tax=Roseobacter sinensis TaxID=2931391 RepID=A0ABT3BA34_9RHOB|nr:hypothetical protein [Roseobacter sp. WL0113]MCV3270408.1 hypothetical protein [Roseobacter sp. WL0113]